MVLIEHWLNTLKDQMDDQVQSILIERKKKIFHPWKENKGIFLGIELQKSSIEDFEQQLIQRKNRISALKSAYHHRCDQVHREMAVTDRQSIMNQRESRKIG